MVTATAPLGVVVERLEGRVDERTARRRSARARARRRCAGRSGRAARRRGRALARGGGGRRVPRGGCGRLGPRGGSGRVRAAVIVRRGRRPSALHSSPPRQLGPELLGHLRARPPARRGSNRVLGHGPARATAARARARAPAVGVACVRHGSLRSGSAPEAWPRGRRRSPAEGPTHRGGQRVRRRPGRAPQGCAQGLSSLDAARAATSLWRAGPSDAPRPSSMGQRSLAVSSSDIGSPSSSRSSVSTPSTGTIRPWECM